MIRTILLLLSFAALAKDPVAPVFADTKGVAIRGYDPVAYFTASKPVEGKREFTYSYMGATFRFASAANRDQFAAEPAKFAPQFGGYCAWAVGNGYTAPTDPAAWKIVEGKLYLNYDGGVQKKWIARMQELIAAGEKNWPKLHN
ncbi:MAG: YHS domain-containing protein [Acidobacteria bacterium]|nr:YHS domain-containing protein [Acidobacteriota bacterium]